MNSNKSANTPERRPEFWAPLLMLSTQEVFSLMLDSTLISPPESLTDERLTVTSMVGLAGDLCGLISLRCDRESASLIASKMLGTDVVNGSQEAIDAIGEVCNMVAGNFKNKIAGLGDGCQLSLPTVISGDDYSLRTLANECTMQCQFLFEGAPLVISLEITS